MASHPDAPSPAGLKLGRLPSPPDARTLHLADYLGADLPAPPPSSAWTDRVKDWTTLGNDRYGDCVFAGALHHEQAWTAYASTEFEPTEQDALAAYTGVTGFNPADPSTDKGANMLQALKYWRTKGIGGRTITAFAACEPSNTVHIQECVALFGGAYVGLALPIAAQGQRVWSVPPGGAVHDGAPGGWGGHCVPVLAYDPHGLTCVTWGAPKRMTWPFFHTYADEAYAVLSQDWMSSSGKAPNGFDLPTLRRDLAAVTR